MEETCLGHTRDMFAHRQFRVKEVPDTARGLDNVVTNSDGLAVR